MPRTHLWFGKNGTWKTTAAIADATPEAPVSYHELEHGGFRRAASRLRLAEGAVLVHRYRIPAPEMEEMGEVHVTAKGGVLPQMDYSQDVKRGLRPVIDTSTRLWLSQRNAMEEAYQKAATRQAMDALGQMRYTAPNARMIAAATFGLEHYDLDVISIAHEDRVFGTTDIKADTMKEIENLVDVMLRFEWDEAERQAVATVWKGGEVGVLKGMKIPAPTLGKVNLLLDCAVAIQLAEMPMPKDYETVLSIGRGLGVA